MKLESSTILKAGSFHSFEFFGTAWLLKNQYLCEDDDVLGVNGAIGNPVLLSQRRRCVNDELLSGLVVCRGRLHLDGVVAVA